MAKTQRAQGRIIFSVGWLAAVVGILACFSALGCRRNSLRSAVHRARCSARIRRPIQRRDPPGATLLFLLAPPPPPLRALEFVADWVRLCWVRKKKEPHLAFAGDNLAHRVELGRTCGDVLCSVEENRSYLSNRTTPLLVAGRNCWPASRKPERQKKRRPLLRIFD